MNESNIGVYSRVWDKMVKIVAEGTEEEKKPVEVE